MKYASVLSPEGRKLTKTASTYNKIDFLRIGIMVFLGYNEFISDFLGVIR